MNRFSSVPSACVIGLMALLISGSVSAQDRHAGVAALQTETPVYGPYDVHSLAGGAGLVKPLPEGTRYTLPVTPYTLSLWVQMTRDTPRNLLLAGVGDPGDEDSHFLGFLDGRPVLRYGVGNMLVAPTALEGEGWHFLAVIFDGVQQSLHVDAHEPVRGNLVIGRVDPKVMLAPALKPAIAPFSHFGGILAHVTLWPTALTAEEMRVMAANPPDASLLREEEASPGWPLQTRAQAGYMEPQDASTMPHSRAPIPKPQAKPLPAHSSTSLTARGARSWTLSNNWRLASALDVKQDGATLSSFGADTKNWMVATVPGTVLTTMVDRGVYPDPDYGLNNLAIPESLNKHDYWYRIEFETPRGAAGKDAMLTFEGINYGAEAWVNGRRLGAIKGAFVRGQFDLTGLLSSDHANILAVRVSPPPHPGIPNEESIAGGPGENGGTMALDGPTFVATEGWDWIPAIRDRNTGIWQDVVLSMTDRYRIGDTKVVTHLPLPDISTADVDIDVPIFNTTNAPSQAKLKLSFEGVEISKQITLQPGTTTVKLRASEFAQLHLMQPRLWWPNGYGLPALYHLKLAVSGARGEADEKTLTFGVREITYELSLFDSAGKLRRVEVDPSLALGSPEEVVDVRHQGMKRTAEFWAASLTPAGERSPAVKTIANPDGLTDLVLKVNGIRVAARGGNWGMDDSRKRVSREHLEPFFRLHREANLNIIRNWVGQNTEEAFFELADEYGMMVWNDFWASTQDYNLEPQDVPLFLDNARDVVARFRNHPSIVIWCGRNEGVPQPILNQGLIELLREEDGTRYYSPDSNRINLRNSGPYRYQDPQLYYTTLDKGFSVELGTSSLSTLESLQASIPGPDQWPISDALAYHDWHQSGNGDTHPLMEVMDRQLGASVSLKDFERKSQMFNYVNHRAIFEGFNQHLWAPNSGRMLWMTQPAWPSNLWQILSSDYDTNASFYAVKKACEPLHIQLDLSDFSVAAVNTTRDASPGLTVTAKVYSLSNELLLTKELRVDLGANSTSALFTLPLQQFFGEKKLVLIRLEMKRNGGEIISQNTYWLAGSDSDYRALAALPAVSLTAEATVLQEGAESIIALNLTNPDRVAALSTKVTLVASTTGSRVLPAYFSDNYITILPGETVHINIRIPANNARMRLNLRGWNVSERSIEVFPLSAGTP